jgi:Na+/alanine symporter
VETRIRVMQIINGAIALGALVAVGLLTFVRTQNNLPPRDPPILSYVVLAFAAIQVVISMVLPNVVAASAARRFAAPPRWYAVYQTRLIVRLALLEGAALALAIAWFIEGWSVTLVVALVFVALMLLQFPTGRRVERWVEAQKELAYQDRAPS